MNIIIEIKKKSIILKDFRVKIPKKCKSFLSKLKSEFRSIIKANNIGIIIDNSHIIIR